LLVDIVSKNGNLLLNVGPKANGTISEIQLDRLHKLGAWLDANGEGIFGSRPWVRPSAASPDGTDVRFTKKADSLYVFFLSRPKGATLTVPGVKAAGNTTARILGRSGPASISQNGNNLLIQTQGNLPESYAIVVKLTPPPQNLT
jgi:alpha-L-fucosidase